MSIRCLMAPAHNESLVQHDGAVLPNSRWSTLQLPQDGHAPQGLVSREFSKISLISSLDKG